MKTKSAKAKGRVLQKLVVGYLRKLGEKFGLVDDDIVSRAMGQAGEDVVLSPAARKVFGDVRIECKNQETLNVSKIYHEHAAKYPNNVCVLVHKKNGQQPLVTLPLDIFMKWVGLSLEGAK